MKVENRKVILTSTYMCKLSHSVTVITSPILTNRGFLKIKQQRNNMYLNTVAILLSGVITWQVCNNTCPVFKLVKA